MFNHEEKASNCSRVLLSIFQTDQMMEQVMATRKRLPGSQEEKQMRARELTALWLGLSVMHPSFEVPLSLATKIL